MTPSKRRHVGLLRGINVGGKNKLPMAALRDIFSALGCTGVRTYIQSGNVVFNAAPDLAGRVPQLVMRAICDQLDISTTVTVRSAEEFGQIAASNPFDTSGDPRFLHVAFLKDVPSAAAIAQLDPDHSPPDVFAVRGPNVYLHYPNGVARSKLTNAYLDARLQTISTMRNWRTVRRLLGMINAPP